ncbi:MULTISPECIES: hypothetical protein [Sphingobacterium]|uniref:hypothetical protein n=1 Tax=Sphingobacterium TaxID=28453 RepID=UPI0013E4E112|nr:MULTISPECIES: hypothetical protein [Sphingobacterium]QIH31972.1 hypothetical protein G6053_03200 [Sphingobacterium sp. DR205]
MKRAFEEPETEQAPKQKSKKNIYIIIGIVLLLAILAGGGYYNFVLRQDLDAIPLDSGATAVGGFENADPKDLEDADGWSSIDEYAHWNNAIFTIPEYDNIPLRYRRGITKIFMGNSYLEPSGDKPIYKFTRIKDRAKSVFCYGNFTDRHDADNWNKEMAFLVEKNDYQSSAIWIISAKGDILFWKEYSSELPLINSFKKGQKIFMDEMKLVPAPADGIIVKNKSSKYALIYNKGTKTFDTYYQYSDSEIAEATAAEEVPYVEELEDITIDSAQTNTGDNE